MDCFWPRCSNHKRCEAYGSCVAKAQAGGAAWPQTPDGLWTTDNAPAIDVLRMVRLCASTWVPEARLLGNVRAGDIVKACDEAVQKLGA